MAYREEERERSSLTVGLREGLSTVNVWRFASYRLTCATLYFVQCVHRDLAARNILIDSRFTLKVADFGLARPLHDEEHYMRSSKKCVPVRWIAVESLFNGIYTSQSDV